MVLSAGSAFACGCPIAAFTSAAAKGEAVVEGDVVFELPEFVYTHVALMHVTRVFRGESSSVVLLFGRGNCGAFPSYGRWVVTRFGATDYDACSGAMPTRYVTPADWAWLGSGKRPAPPFVLIGVGVAVTAAALWFGWRSLRATKR